MGDEMLTFDRLQVGHVYPEVCYRFRQEQVAKWIASFEDDTTALPAGSGAAARTEVPAALTSLYLLDAILKAYANRPKGNVHAKQEFVWYAPLHVGDELSTAVIVADKYLKRGRRYVVTETRTRNQEGRLVGTGRMTSIFAR